MSIDYTYHYRKWNTDTQQQRRASVKHCLDLYREHFIGNKNGAILDVGCGNGCLLEALRLLGYTESCGIEIDAGQTDSCRKNGLNVTFVEDSRQYLVENANSYDQILAVDLIEHIPHDQQLEFVTALAGALKTDGRLLCTTPNANSFLGARYRYIDWTHCSSFTEHSLDFLLYSGGFRKIHILPGEKFERPTWWFLPVAGVRLWWAQKFFRIWRRLQYMAELGPEEGRHVPLSANLLAIATKP